MKRKIAALVVFIVGLGFLLYPVVGNIINVIKQNSVQSQYEQMVEQMNEESKEQVKSEAEEYNKKLAAGEISVTSTDEDSITEDFDNGSGYSSAMNVGTSEIAFIKVPKINIELPIYRGTAAVTLEKGIGHLRNTSLPVGGESSHCVLTGHTGMPSSMFFTDLDKMTEGDMFYIEYLDEIHAYRVDQIKVVEPTDTSDLKIFPGKDYITLLTCTPYGINSHRLLVRGERVSYDGGIVFGEDSDTAIASSAVVSDTDSEELTATADTVQASEELNNTIKEDLKNNNSMISVYGLYVPLWVIIAAIGLILTAIVICIVVSVKRSVRRKE